MKKSVLTLLLAGVLTIGGTVIAFADDIAPMLNCNQNRTTGVQGLMNDGLSFEEAKEEMLNVKLERVDTAVENGVITSERAEEIKNEMENVMVLDKEIEEEMQDLTVINIKQFISGKYYYILKRSSIFRFYFSISYVQSIMPPKSYILL